VIWGWTLTAVVPPRQCCQLLTLATTLWVNAFGVAAAEIAGLSKCCYGLSRALKDKSNERLARRRSDSGDVCIGWVAGIRSAAHSHASRFACPPMRPVQTMLSQIQPVLDIQRYGDTEHPTSPAQG
jgi:hypothetical protein